MSLRNTTTPSWETSTLLLTTPWAAAQATGPSLVTTISIVVGIIAVLAFAGAIVCLVKRRLSNRAQASQEKSTPTVFVIPDRHGDYSCVDERGAPGRSVQGDEEVAVHRTVYKSQRPPSVYDKMGPLSPTFGDVGRPSPLGNSCEVSVETTRPETEGEAAETYDEMPAIAGSGGTNRGRNMYPSRGDRNVPPRAGPHPLATKSQQSEKRDSGYLSVEDLASQRSSVRLGSEDLEDIYEEERDEASSAPTVARHGAFEAPRRYLHSPRKRPHSGSLGAKMRSNSKGKFQGSLSGSSPSLDVHAEAEEAEAVDKAQSLPSLVHDARLAFRPMGLQPRSVDPSEWGDSRELQPDLDDSVYGSEGNDLYTDSSLAYSSHSCDDYQGLALVIADPTAFGESSDYLSPHPVRGRREDHRESASGRGSASSGLSSARQSSGAGSITSGPSSDASFSDYPSQEGDLSPLLVEGVLKPNLMGRDWQWNWTALPQGCTLQRKHSDIILQVPQGAVPTPTSIHGSVFTHFGHVKDHIHIPACQMIISPVVELFTESGLRFDTHVRLKLPHNLPAHFNQAELKVFCFQYDIEPRLSPVPRFQDSSAAPPECFYQITENEEIWVHTCHFSIYFCTYCKKDINISLAAMVFCGPSGNQGQESFTEGEVRVSVVVLDNKHKIADIVEDIKMEESERGLRFVDNKSLRLYTHVAGHDQLAFQCTGVEPVTWKHKTRSDNRPIFDEKQVYEMAEVVACCQDCERHRVEWVLAPDPSSHRSLPSPLTFSGVVDVLNVLAARRPSGDEDKKTTFFLSNIEFFNPRGSMQGSRRKREERFSKARRILEVKLSDQQTLELAQGLDLAKKDITNLLKGYQGQRLRVRLLEMSYDHMHAQTFWGRLPNLLRNMGAVDALRELQSQCLLIGRASPETGEQRSPDNNGDTKTHPKVSPASENTQPKFRFFDRPNPGVAPPVKPQPAEHYNQQNRRDADKNKTREALRPVPHRDNRAVQNAGRSLMLADHGQTVPKSPYDLPHNPRQTVPQTPREQTVPKIPAEPAGQSHGARVQGRNDETRAMRRPVPGPSDRDERDERAGQCNTRLGRDQEKGDLGKPEDLDSTQKKEIAVDVQQGRRQERLTYGGSAAALRGRGQGRGRGRPLVGRRETDDESGETTHLKMLV